LLGTHRLEQTVPNTVATKGLSLEAGQEVAEKETNVIIAARDEEGPREGLEFIGDDASSTLQRFHYIAVDLTSYEGVQNMIKEATT